MTLIFGFSRQDVPILCGDTLLTHYSETPTTRRLPASGTLPDSIAVDFGVSISGLKQKVNIIHDTVVLAWAGPYVSAFGLAKEIKSHVERFGPSAKEIMRILEANAEPDLSCLAMVLDGDGTKLSYVWHRVEGTDLRRFQHVRYAGTGSDYFKETIAKLDSVDPIPNPAIDNFASVLCDALAFASQSIGRELYTFQNLVERWGGAIELCYRGPTGFTKLDKIAFAHFEYDETTPERGLTWKPKLLLNRYNGEELECIALLCAQTNDTSIFSIVRDDTTVIRPLISEKATHPQLLPKTFDYNWLCTHFTYSRAGKSLWSMAHVTACSNGPRPFRVTVQGTDVIVKFTNKLGDWMRKQILAYQRGEKPSAL
ncbi:hypothetical protein [Bradyrhizobium sp. OAE829]|uniref:hypothetical protein n=1 Tax=Bradyrhizobium sp. OAE829 TaxID=2663807 RepID=UPI00178B0178